MAAMLTRREILTGAAAILVAGPANAQKSPPARIGWLSAGSDPDPFLDGFREGLRTLGYVEGQTVVLEIRHADGSLERLRAMTADLSRAQVAVVIAAGIAARAAMAITDIPVLVAVSGDPVAGGWARSVSRPGGNFTGSTFLSLEVAGKRVELLKQAVPRLRTLAALSNTDHPGEHSERRATEAAAQSLGVSLVYVPFSQSPFAGTAELDKALEAARRAQPDAMVVFPEGATMANRAAIARFAIGGKMPTMFGWSEYVDAGGLMSYGANQRQTYMRLAAFADKILRGAKPADLPIEQPTKFELVVNLKTAKTLGLTLPEAVLLRADRVVDSDA
jgi:putative tryptophan/tyrosine transport system substrate-binding protein